MKRSCVAIAFLCLLALIGCGQNGGSLVTASGSVQVEETMASYYASGERVFLVVWHDMIRSLGSGGGHGGSGSSSSARKTEIEGDYQTTDGRGFRYTCRTTDGITGFVVIDGVEYDLADGCLFLVASHAEGSSVTQLKRELVMPGAPQEMFKALADTDPQIAAFVRGGDHSD
ncbi:MAG: hypothetical protein JW958_09050 [Candidatus Eisenbacteria bacterium]|nr:hypothetical protein [Candidatus Eisenbacteria bacterium]